MSLFIWISLHIIAFCNRLVPFSLASSAIRIHHFCILVPSVFEFRNLLTKGFSHYFFVQHIFDMRMCIELLSKHKWCKAKEERKNSKINIKTKWKPIMVQSDTKTTTTVQLKLDIYRITSTLNIQAQISMQTNSID